jgi:sialate O-acetylesterase
MLKRLFTVAALLFLAKADYAQVRLPRLVRDSMVLQRDAPINIWGWASKGEKVTIQFNRKTYKTSAGNDGKWAVKLTPQKPGGPYEMSIKGTNQITLKDILIGDVWFCSGQSNMVHQMELHRERYAEDIASANYPQIRHFFVATATNVQGPQEDLPSGNWKTANPQDVRQFSAVAYFFALKLYKKYGVPIGLINASVGGTPIEAWMSEDAFKDFPSITATVQKNKDTAYINGLNRRGMANARPPRSEDKGMLAAVRWYDPNYIPKGWRNINIPGYWEDQGIKDLNGVVWYRKEIDVPATMTGMPAKIAMGRIVDADVLYVNGVQVGNTTYQYPQRRYTVPANVLKPGKNVLVIRVTNSSGKGGFVPDKPYYLSAGNQTIDLKGDWKYKVGEAYTPASGFGGGGISLQNAPTALFNAMAAPAINYTIKGALWYQGESNAGRAADYARLMPALINDWRQQWKQPALPFLFVQLPNFMDAAYLPSESQWAEMREAQLKTLSVPNTGMAVAIDLGEWNDIHPDNKKDVGERLALAAQHLVYSDKDVVYSGPLFEAATVQGNKIAVRFTNTGSGLITSDGEPPAYFAIAGADKKFVWAKATIENNQVILWNDTVAQPLYVRYAWADNPQDANLYNKEGLPASPFRTDK